ncbi:uncharacterized protein VTP21DRAFT_8665 [Calcarisporiella thermophila]|uniref:uncharacterized protein n=1 Tax=Calcarisporiella thermophila TaxID=911321 RepID=UPI0037437548
MAKDNPNHVEFADSELDVNALLREVAQADGMLNDLDARLDTFNSKLNELLMAFGEKSEDDKSKSAAQPDTELETDKRENEGALEENSAENPSA